MTQRVLDRKTRAQLAKLDKALALYCTEKEASEMTGYSTAWFRKYRTTDKPGTPIVKFCPGRTALYLRESLKNIRNPEKAPAAAA